MNQQRACAATQAPNTCARPSWHGSTLSSPAPSTLVCSEACLAVAGQWAQPGLYIDAVLGAGESAL